MTFVQLLLHGLNFLAPALFVALFLPAANRWVLRRAEPRFLLWVQAAVLFVVGLAVLIAGLVLLGADGAMLTYLALVLCGASAQWLMGRSWR